MRIALIGYGKMGKEVERVAQLRGIEVSSIIDPGLSPSGIFSNSITKASLENADVAIDFTVPDSVIPNVRKVASLGKNMVVATTGWHDHLEEAGKIIASSGTGLIYSSNFSIGVNAYYRILEQAAKIFDRLPDYDVYGYELHHNQKADSPSGTAKAVGDILVKNISRKKTLVFDRLDRKISPEELHIASVRAGSIPGTHVIGFDAAADTIEIKHVARSRSGFASGALLAAEWIHGKKGFFSINDFMDDYFRK